jgi:hypothetical protein
VEQGRPERHSAVAASYAARLSPLWVDSGPCGAFAILRERERVLTQCMHHELRNISADDEWIGCDR